MKWRSESRELGKERERELWKSHPGLHPPSTTLLRNGLDSLPEKTKSATAWGVRVRSDWATARASATVETAGHAPVRTPLLQMQVEDLAYWMSKFVLEARKAGGSEYPPKTLYALACCFKRYCEASGFHDIPFKKCALTT